MSNTAIPPLIPGDVNHSDGLFNGDVAITGDLDVTGGIQVTAGDVVAGSSGNAGTFVSWPPTADSGIFTFAAADNASGNFDTTVSNGTAVGQDQVISIPDAGAATGTFALLATAAGSQTFTDDLTMGSLTLGTAGDKVTVTSGANASVGTATVANTTTTVVVATTAVSTASLIFLSPVEAWGAATQFWADTIVDGTSFTINVDADPTQDVDFNYWIIN